MKSFKELHEGMFGGKKDLPKDYNKELHGEALMTWLKVINTESKNVLDFAKSKNDKELGSALERLNTAIAHYNKVLKI